jgi:hypothetical protein
MRSDVYESNQRPDTATLSSFKNYASMSDLKPAVQANNQVHFVKDLISA